MLHTLPYVPDLLIEYKLENLDDPCPYSLVLSFPFSHLKEAEIIFNKLTEWGLPARLDENRLNLFSVKEKSSASGPGVYASDDGLPNVYIIFPCTDSASSFHTLLTQGNTNPDSAFRLPTFSQFSFQVKFPKPELIHPDFSLQNRIRKTRDFIHREKFYLLILDNLDIFPRDIIYHILRISCLLDRIDRTIKLNNKYGLPKSEIFTYTKINCTISTVQRKFRPGSLFLHNIFDLYFECTNEKEAERLWNCFVNAALGFTWIEPKNKKQIIVRADLIASSHDRCLSKNELAKLAFFKKMSEGTREVLFNIINLIEPLKVENKNILSSQCLI